LTVEIFAVEFLQLYMSDLIVIFMTEVKIINCF